MDGRDRRTISFRAEDRDLVAYLDSCENASEEVRAALRQYVDGKGRVEVLCELMVQQHQRMADMLERLERNGVSVTKREGYTSDPDAVEEMKSKLRNLGI